MNKGGPGPPFFRSGALRLAVAHGFFPHLIFLEQAFALVLMVRLGFDGFLFDLLFHAIFGRVAGQNKIIGCNARLKGRLGIENSRCRVRQMIISRIVRGAKRVGG